MAFKIYTMTNCPNCEEFKNYCKNNNLGYEEINVDEDFQAKAKLIMNDFEEMPVVEKDGKMFHDSLNNMINFIN